MAGMKGKLTAAAVGILFIGWVVGLGFYPFLVWSPLNCSNLDVDISTGRIRHQRYLLGICVSEQIEESLLSRTLKAADTPPNWHVAVTVSPLVSYSPLHRFGAAPSQIKMIGLIWDAAPLRRKQGNVHVKLSLSFGKRRIMRERLTNT